MYSCVCVCVCAGRCEADREGKEGRGALGTPEGTSEHTEGKEHGHPDTEPRGGPFEIHGLRTMIHTKSGILNCIVLRKMVV